MIIGLAGYYNINSYSDDCIAYAIKHAFDIEHQGIEWRILPLGVGKYDDLDLVILGGGSLLGMALPALVNGLKSCAAPFVIFGTGVREFMCHECLGYLWERAALIGVRGHYGRNALFQAGYDVSRIRFVGDPIFLLPPSDGVKEPCIDEPYIAGVFRSGYNDKWLVRAFRRISELAGMPVKYVCMSKAQGDTGCGAGAGLGLAATYNVLRDASFYFGNRLHPMLLCLLNGIPSIGVELEFNKVKCACSVIDYPYYVNEGAPLHELEHVYYTLRDDDMNKYAGKIDSVRMSLKKNVSEALGLVK